MQKTYLENTSVGHKTKMLIKKRNLREEKDVNFDLQFCTKVYLVG